MPTPDLDIQTGASDSGRTFTADELRQILAMQAALLQSGFGAGGLAGGAFPGGVNNRGGIFGVPVGLGGLPGAGQQAASGPQLYFTGGSPWPVDPGPARLQNALVLGRDLPPAIGGFIKSPLGQRIANLLRGK